MTGRPAERRALKRFKNHPVTGEEVRQIRIAISDCVATILRNHCPTTGVEAKFSMELAVSSALVAHRVGLPELTDGFVRRRDIQALIERVPIDIARVITTHPESD